MYKRQVSDGRGNKYLFKENSVSCRDDKRNLRITYTYCMASAIKTDIAGQRYVIDFPEALCWNSENRIRRNALTCVAARQMGKYQTLMNKDDCYSCKYYD